MKILPIVGGWYGENLPNGEYAVAMPGQGVQMHHGFVQNPPNSGLGPLYVRVTNVGRFAFAGQPHDGPKGTLYWEQGTWTLLPQISYGVSGHIFDQQGVLRILEAGPNQTSQGYRYVARDGRLVLGDETYADLAREIWEWTEYDGITIGQGERGAIVLANGKRYLLERGDCRFIRFNKTGDDCAVTIVKLEERQTILKWFTVAEIADLPIIGTVPAPKPPPPPDPGHPAPPKEPPVSDRTAVVEKWKEVVERSGFPVTGSIVGAFEVSQRVAWELRDEGIGLLVKRNGDNIVTWRGESYSAGRVAYKQDGRTYPIKIFTDVPATNAPKWDVGTEPVPNDQFWAEAQEPDPLGEPEDPDEPDTPPPPFPDPQLLALVDSVKAFAVILDALAQDVANTYDRVEALDAQIREIARRLGEVQEQQYQALDGRVPVFGGTVVLTPRRAKG